MVKTMGLNYNIQTYNCTTFAVDTVQIGGAAAGNFMPVKEHDWILPNNLREQVANYQARP